MGRLCKCAPCYLQSVPCAVAAALWQSGLQRALPAAVCPASLLPACLRASAAGRLLAGLRLEVSSHLLLLQPARWRPAPFCALQASAARTPEALLSLAPSDFLLPALATGLQVPRALLRDHMWFTGEQLPASCRSCTTRVFVLQGGTLGLRKALIQRRWRASRVSQSHPPQEQAAAVLPTPSPFPVCCSQLLTSPHCWPALLLLLLLLHPFLLTQFPPAHWVLLLFESAGTSYATLFACAQAAVVACARGSYAAAAAALAIPLLCMTCLLALTAAAQGNSRPLRALQQVAEGYRREQLPLRSRARLLAGQIKRRLWHAAGLGPPFQP